MAFSFDWNILTIFEIVGIALAVIGFLNLSEKLEAMFTKVKVGFTKLAKFEKENAKAFWPPHKNIKRLFIDMLSTLPIHLTILVGFIVWKDGVALLWDAFLALTLPYKILIFLAIIFGFLLNELFTHYILKSVIAAIAKAFEQLFHILGKPPSGVTGTLGLLITLLSFGISHVNAV